MRGAAYTELRNADTKVRARKNKKSISSAKDNYFMDTGKSISFLGIKNPLIQFEFRMQIWI